MPGKPLLNSKWYTSQSCPCRVNHYLTANGTLVSLSHTFTSKDMYMKFLMTCTMLIYSSIAGLSYIMCTRNKHNL